MTSNGARPLGILFEHPAWFGPLFSELDRRGLPYAPIHAPDHSFDPDVRESPYALVLNRMSPSAHLRGHGSTIRFTSHYLAHLESLGVPLLNGVAAWRTEISKARQLDLFQELGIPYPRARVIHDPLHAPDAASGLRFPVVVKPNVGGSGAGIRRFDRPAALSEAAATGDLDLGVDGTALVQEFIPARDGRIVRVEVMDDRVLYAIGVRVSGEDFNLCPADICQDEPRREEEAGVGAEAQREGNAEGESGSAAGLETGTDAGGRAIGAASGGVAVGGACPADAGESGDRVVAYDPPTEVQEKVRRIVSAGGMQIGGVEYLEDDRDGQRYYYDVNALSNFVADAPRIVGFDPFTDLADWLEREWDDVSDV